MGSALRILTTALLLAAAGPLAVAAPENGDVAGQILARAVESYKEGKYEPTVGGISAALRGGLSGAQMARALYYRGLAYRKMGQPGSAISDLTRALDYEGLSDAERSDAMEARSAAYQEAGIADQETVVVTSRQSERKSESPPPPVVVPAPPSTAATGSAAPTVEKAPKWDAGTQVAVAAPLPVVTSAPPPQAEAKPAPKPIAETKAAAAAKPVPQAEQKPAPKPIVESKPAAAAKPATEAKPVAAARPAPASKPEAAKPAAPAAAIWPTAHVTEAKAPAPPAKVKGQTEPRKSETVVATAMPPIASTPPASKDTTVAKTKASPPAEPTSPFVTKVAALSPAVTGMPPAAPVATTAAPPITTAALPPSQPEPVAPAAAPAYLLLIGETSSRSEAFALAIRLTSQRGASLGPRKPQIAAGTMADVVVYRVRLGPFADAGQAQSVCQSLREGGYPCIFE